MAKIAQEANFHRFSILGTNIDVAAAVGFVNCKLALLSC